MNNMKILEMNNDYRFDIDLNLANIKIDNTNPFCKREIPSIDAINKFISSKHELKNQQSALTTDNFFIEYGMLVKGKYSETGIITTEAEYQTYNVHECLYSFPTIFIKYLYNNRKTLNLMETTKNDTDYIGYGILVPISRINVLYSDYVKKKAIQRVFKNK